MSDPKSASEALESGWLMVFVIPSQKSKASVKFENHLARILEVSLKSARLPFTYKGAVLPEGTFAFWVNGLRWPEGLYPVLSAMYSLPEAVRFGHEVLALYEPDFVFDRRRKLSDTLNEPSRNHS